MGIFISLLAAAATIAIVAFDRRRFLTQVDLHHWRKRQYILLLPNFLEALYRGNLRSPWPARDDEISATWFVIRVGRQFSPLSRSVRRQFMRCHIHLFALLERVKPFLQDALLGELQRLATRQLGNVMSGWEYQRLSDSLVRIDELRQSFQQRLDVVDRAFQQQFEQTQILRQLRQIHAIFREHGFSLFPAFDALGRWEEMSGPELSSEVMRIVNAPRPRNRLPAMI